MEETETDKGIAIEIEVALSKSKPYLKLTLKAGEMLGITFYSNSCGVQSVEANSVAHSAGVKNGWVISEIDGRTVVNDKECMSAITNGLQSNNECEITFNKVNAGDKDQYEIKNYEVKNYIPSDL